MDQVLAWAWHPVPVWAWLLMILFTTAVGKRR